MDEGTQKKIIIESKYGLKTLKKYITNEDKIADFMGGKCNDIVTSNPGVASEIYKENLETLCLKPKQIGNLRKYFWDVDLSVPENYLGVEIKENADKM